jgi:CPA2 family monovalent cation:H+ antiporter-2
LREHAVVCGYGRLGKEVEAALRAFEIPTLVIERDPDVIHDLLGRDVRCLYGDGSHREPLDRAAVDHAALIVVAWPDIESVRLTVSRARALNPKAPIFALAHRHAEAKHLMQMGATVVVQPDVEAAASLIGHALSRLAVPKERIGRYLEQARERM